MQNPSSEKDVRPWGRYEVLQDAPDFKVKRLEVNPGSRFSLQTHARRAERWIVVSGEGKATVGDREIAVSRGSFIEIGVGVVHRLQNTGRVPLVVVEVQIGDYFGEDDIQRLSDDYARP